MCSCRTVDVVFYVPSEVTDRGEQFIHYQTEVQHPCTDPFVLKSIQKRG